MSSRPIFVATHPRACSTAFERVFMTCRDTTTCVHEPFADAWYFGPERLSDRFGQDEEARKRTGHDQTTYCDIFKAIDGEEKDGKRIFIKDMAQYWLPLASKSESVRIAPSLVNYRRGVGTNDVNNNSNVVREPGNPTVIPDALLRKYHFTFLIRHPRSSVPSYYRCTIPPLNKMTHFEYYDPLEAGYKELRQLFDYLTTHGHIGPKIAGTGNRDLSNGVNGNVGTNGTTVQNGDHARVEICVVDADDLLDNPYAVIEAYCQSVGMKYSPKMLKWDDEESQTTAKEIFEKWKGFHEDALDSSELKPRTHKKAIKSDEQLLAEWTEKYGSEAATIMMQTVKDSEADYEYLKQFALKV